MRGNDGEGLFCFAVLYLLGLLADVSQDAAISVQDLAIDKVGSVGSQEHAGADHVLGVPQRPAGVLAQMKVSKGWRLPSGWISRRGAVWAVAM